MAVEKNDLDASTLERLTRTLTEWEQKELASFLARQPESKEHYHTASRLLLKRVYTALDTNETPLEDIGLPGSYPFTRGPYPTCTAVDYGPCGRSPASGPGPIPTSVSSI